MEEVDLTAYPVIRLDQIRFLSKSALEKAIADVQEILAGVNHGNKSALDSYLMKQCSQMERELEKKLAEERVLSLLSTISSDIDKPRENDPREKNSVTTSAAESFAGHKNFLALGFLTGRKALLDMNSGLGMHTAIVFRFPTIFMTRSLEDGISSSHVEFRFGLGVEIAPFSA